MVSENHYTSYFNTTHSRKAAKANRCKRYGGTLLNISFFFNQEDIPLAGTAKYIMPIGRQFVDRKALKYYLMAELRPN